MKKIFSLFAALTLSVGLWAENSVITFTSTGKLYPVNIDELVEDVRMGDGAKWAAFKAQYPEFKDVGFPIDLKKMEIVIYNPNAFLDANDQVLTFTIDYDESTHAGTFTVNGKLVKIAYDAFSSSKALTSITLPEGVTSIESNAFFGCTALTSVILPESLSSIGTDGFYRYSSLSSVTIPANVTYLGFGAFGENSSLADVYVAWTTTLPTLEINATFLDSPIDNATLHVPADSKELYQDADVWKDFGSIVEYDVLQGAKDAAIAEINAAIDGVTDEAILAIATAAKAQIEQATTEAGVNSIKTQALADIAAANFAKNKDAAITEITAAREGIQNENLNNWIDGAINDIQKGGPDATPGIDEIKEEILNVISFFKEGKAEGIEEGKAEAQAALPTDPEGTTGHAVVITKGDKSVTLINPESVSYIKQE